MNLVLDVFKESLFALNHSEIFSSSEFTFENNVLMFLPEKKRFVSSANRMNLRIAEEKHKSFIYTRNSNGPNIDPCGTPQLIHFNSD